MTEEEKVALTAAVEWAAHADPQAHPLTRTNCAWWDYDLAMALRALRESRKPKPKWSISEGRYQMLLHHAESGTVASFHYRSVAERVCRLLNESESGAVGETGETG